MMQITQHPVGDALELRLNGRIDAGWAEHVGSTIEKAVRAGSHRIALNCSEVNYISSLGIGVIVSQYKLLKSVNGSLVITEPSKFVREILTIVGLADVLIEQRSGTKAAAPATVRREIHGGAAYEIYPQVVENPLTCTLIGDPAKLTTTGFRAADCRSIAFPGHTFGLGLGAFGAGFEDCETRFGEFLAAGGCAVVLPTSEPHAVPDYVMQQGNLVPEVATLYALSGKGDFATMVRFDALPDGPGRIGLSDLVSTLVELSAENAIGFVVLAESTSIVGTSLLKSPALGPVDYSVPGVRDWLSFTTERISDKHLVLLVGVAGVNLGGEAADFVRPIRPKSPIHAHMHGAVFGYRPVQRGGLPFDGTVSKLVATSNPKALLHLMADCRQYEGVGETELSRGACWIGPLKTLTRG